ncbi:MAG: DUF975 family protein [Paraprevotella sp.]|nr:DUF975 family protein [Paraprevotella sp.]
METTTNQNQGLFGRSWSSLKGKRMKSVLALALYGLLCLLAAVVFCCFIIIVAFLFGCNPESETIDKVFDSSFSQVFSQALFGIPLMVFTYGIMVFFLHAVRDGEVRPSFKDLFFGFRPARYGASLLHGLYVFGGTLCCIVPGVILDYCYAMVPFILHDHPELSATEALRRSRSLMKGNKAELFFWELGLGVILGVILLISLIVVLGLGWLLLRMMSVSLQGNMGVNLAICGVALVYFFFMAFPYMMRFSLRANFYELLLQEKAAAEAATEEPHAEEAIAEEPKN